MAAVSKVELVLENTSLLAAVSVTIETLKAVHKQNPHSEQGHIAYRGLRRVRWVFDDEEMRVRTGA